MIKTFFAALVRNALFGLGLAVIIAVITLVSTTAAQFIYAMF